MKVHSKASLFVVMLGVLGALSIPAVAADPATAQIKAEIARLQQSIKDKPVTDKDFGPIATMAEGALGASTAALNSGQVYLAIEKLGQAEDLLQGARAGADRAEVEKGGFPAFQSQWDKVSLRLTALDKEAHVRPWNHSPVAVRAAGGSRAGQSYPSARGRPGLRRRQRPERRSTVCRRSRRRG